MIRRIDRSASARRRFLRGNGGSGGPDCLNRVRSRWDDRWGEDGAQHETPRESWARKLGSNPRIAPRLAYRLFIRGWISVLLIGAPLVLGLIGILGRR